MKDVVLGFLHPLTGADHILAMVAIGIWSSIAGAHARWVWPVTFVSMVLVGFAAAVLGMQVPLVEPAIDTSTMVLGLLIAFAAGAPVWLGVAIAGLFAFFHGHAHGTEFVAMRGDLFAYATGFSLATAGLHVVGIVAGLSIQKAAGQAALQTTGGLVAIGGFVLIAGLT